MDVCITNESKGKVLVPRAKVASSLLDRCRGLLGTISLSMDDGLWITPCRSVHTFFMTYPIDILFLDDQGVVLSRKTLLPWRLSAWERRAQGVLELAAGKIAQSKTDVGDRLTVKPI